MAASTQLRFTSFEPSHLPRRSPSLIHAVCYGCDRRQDLFQARNPGGQCAPLSCMSLQSRDQDMSPLAPTSFSTRHGLRWSVGLQNEPQKTQLSKSPPASFPRQQYLLLVYVVEALRPPHNHEPSVYTSQRDSGTNRTSHTYLGTRSKSENGFLYSAAGRSKRIDLDSTHFIDEGHFPKADIHMGHLAIPCPTLSLPIRNLAVVPPWRIIRY